MDAQSRGNDLRYSRYCTHWLHVLAACMSEKRRFYINRFQGQDCDFRKVWLDQPLGGGYSEASNIWNGTTLASKSKSTEPGIHLYIRPAFGISWWHPFWGTKRYKKYVTCIVLIKILQAMWSDALLLLYSFQKPPDPMTRQQNGDPIPKSHRVHEPNLRPLRSVDFTSAWTNRIMFPSSTKISRPKDSKYNLPHHSLCSISCVLDSKWLSPWPPNTKNHTVPTQLAAALGWPWLAKKLPKAASERRDGANAKWMPRATDCPGLVYNGIWVLPREASKPRCMFFSNNLPHPKK